MEQWEAKSWFLTLPRRLTPCVTLDRSLTLSRLLLPALYNEDVVFRESTNSSSSDLPRLRVQ